MDPWSITLEHDQICKHNETFLGLIVGMVNKHVSISCIDSLKKMPGKKWNKHMSFFSDLQWKKSRHKIKTVKQNAFFSHFQALYTYNISCFFPVKMGPQISVEFFIQRYEPTDSKLLVNGTGTWICWRKCIYNIWATKKTRPYFRWNTACLIGILIMVYSPLYPKQAGFFHCSYHFWCIYWVRPKHWWTQWNPWRLIKVP